jgi:predicted O-methyltransferase YrrM
MSWQLPVKTEWMREQSEHTPSMEYAKDIYRVASRLEDFTALEIGAAWGFSTLAILEAGAKHLMSVDNNALIKAPGEVEANGYKDRYVWNYVRSDKYWEENANKFDLIYIDGSHLYRDVKNDLYQAWQRLDDGGLLLVDDWDHAKNISAENDTTEYGVSLACWEFWRDHPCEAGIEGRILWFQK